MNTQNQTKLYINITILLLALSILITTLINLKTLLAVTGIVFIISGLSVFLGFIFSVQDYQYWLTLIESYYYKVTDYLKKLVTYL